MIRIGFGQTRLTDLLNNINGSNNETTKTEETDLFSFQEVSFVSLNKTNEEKEAALNKKSETEAKTKAETDVKTNSETGINNKTKEVSNNKTNNSTNNSTLLDLFYQKTGKTESVDNKNTTTSTNNSNNKKQPSTGTTGTTTQGSEKSPNTTAQSANKQQQTESQNSNIFNKSTSNSTLLDYFFNLTGQTEKAEESNKTTETNTDRTDKTQNTDKTTGSTTNNNSTTSSNKPQETTPAYTPTVEAIPTSQEDIEAIWTEITKAHGPIANFTSTLTYSASNFYAQLNYMIESDNPVVKQFAEMFKNTFDSLNLDQAGGAALMERITANMQEKVYGKGVGISIGLLMEEPLKDYLGKLDTDKDGSIFDELDMIIQEEASKVKNFTQEEIENATTMDIEKLLNPTGESSNKTPLGAVVDDSSVDTSRILENLPDMLLCDDAGVRKFGNMLNDLFNKYNASEDEEKEKLIGKLFDEINYQSSLKSWEESQGKPLDERTYIGVKPKAIYYTNGSFINKDELQNFDLDNDGNMFDDIENIVNSENFDKRCKSMTNDFWDTDTMFDWATMYLSTSSEEATATKNSLTYEELFKLATNESWNDENNDLFGMIWRNVDEIDKNKDGKISKDEMQTVVGKCTSKTSLGSNISNLDEARATEYAKLNNQEKLNKVIEEAKRYCTMMGWDDYLEVLNGNGGH